MYQKIRRAIIVPSYPKLPPEASTDDAIAHIAEVLKVLAENYQRLAREVLDCHNQIQVYQLPVAGGAVLRLVPWIPPFYDVNYSAFCTPDWATTVFYSLKNPGSITFNFGAAAPGPGGNILVLGIR
jgi:hypothetical protein